MYSHAHSTIIHHNQNMETTLCDHGHMNKENLVCVCVWNHLYVESWSGGGEFVEKWLPGAKW